MKKRVFSLLLALIMATTLILGALPAMAANTITVYVQAPDDWYYATLYVWNNDGAYSGWPGTYMNWNTNGWWYLEIPAGYPNVIVTDSYGTQTFDLKMDGYSDCWIKLNNMNGEKYEATVYTDAACTQPYEHEQETLNSMSIVGSGLPGLSEWDIEDPAGEMNEISPGIYSLVLSFEADDRATFKFCGNHDWGCEYQFGGLQEDIWMYSGYGIYLGAGGLSYNINFITYYTCNIRITLDINPYLDYGDNPTLTIEETYDEPDVSPSHPEEPEEMITVYAKVPYGWNDVGVWIWDVGTGEDIDMDPWPGQLKMTLNDDGWYSVQVPARMTGILVNANGGGILTPDITGFLPGYDLWIDAYTDPYAPVYSYSEITDIPCKHSEYDYYGYCVECGELHEHEYKSDYYCFCGDYCYDRTTVYFKNTEDFSNVYVYWQYDTSYDWTLMPGISMELVKDDVYMAEVPSNALTVTFNDNWYSEITVGLDGMTSSRKVYNPETSSWITYEQALPPVVEEPDLDPEPIKPTIPNDNDEHNSNNNNNRYDDDDDDDDDDRRSGSSSSDPSWIFITLAALIVVGMVVMLVLTLKKKN